MLSLKRGDSASWENDAGEAIRNNISKRGKVSFFFIGNAVLGLINTKVWNFPKIIPTTVWNNSSKYGIPLVNNFINSDKDIIFVTDSLNKELNYAH